MTCCVDFRPIEAEMHPSVLDHLRAINRKFYEHFAAEYSETRRELAPGMARALHALGDFDSLLDLGCGDGRVGWAIAGGLLDRPLAHYVGVDASVELLNQRGGLPAQLGTWQAVIADFCEAGWTKQLEPHAPFDAAVCFSALHHVPSRALRVRVLGELCTLLRPNSRLAVSVWQLTQHERFVNKLVDPQSIGLKAEQLELGDILVDWRRGGSGVRYIHEFRDDELSEELNEAGFSVREHWRSDGKTGDLGLYMIAVVREAN
jgi:SAM-dependent methyltransferase